MIKKFIIIVISILILYLILQLNKKTENYTNKFKTISNKNVKLSPKLSKDDIINLKKGQHKMTYMMKEFDRICRKHNIRYFVVGGTLIGTLLYEGWIPWDSDIDLEIMESDYDKFKSVVQKELPKNLWFQNNETDKFYSKNNGIIGKIRDLNSCYIEYTNNGGTSWHNGLQIDINLCKINTSDNSVIFTDSENNKHINGNDIFPLRESNFEGIPIFIMNKSEKYLTNKYGKGWTKILPIKQRIGHEGKIDANNTCKFHLKKYPELYKNQK